MGNKWGFTIKQDGRYCARIVALGYTQIPGVDFTKNFLPVVDDITFRLMLVISIVMKYQIVVLDVEAAFLHGDLVEEIYMVLPTGFHHLPENVKLLRDRGYNGPIEKVKDLKFVHMCLAFLGFTVELPMSVYIDNIRAIDMLHNQSTKA